MHDSDHGHAHDHDHTHGEVRTHASLNGADAAHEHARTGEHDRHDHSEEQTTSGAKKA
jgi:hypothetical protein